MDCKDKSTVFVAHFHCLDGTQAQVFPQNPDFNPS